ncbi:hypothetical protein MXB_1967 [Myxobolus squamalis]|nr:hypothetical protein MXB_1967 [Myxobolus squamalis]
MSRILIVSNFKKITSMQDPVTNENPVADNDNESSKNSTYPPPPPLHEQKKHENSNREVKSIDTNKLNSSTSSEKESIGEIESFKSRKNIRPSVSERKFTRKVEINQSDYSTHTSDLYCHKVDKLRKTLEDTLSHWIMSARGQVDDTFYENVRRAFESFMDEIEHYEYMKNVPCDNKKTIVSNTSYEHDSDLTYHLSYKKDHYSQKFTNQPPTSGPSLANALSIVETINQRLKNLIEMLSKYKSDINKPDKYDKKNSLDSKNAKKCIAPSPQAAEHLLKYIRSKLRKYKRKYANIEKKCDPKKDHDLSKKNYSCNPKKTAETARQHSDFKSYPTGESVRVAVWMRSVPPNEIKKLPKKFPHIKNVKCSSESEAKSSD